MASNSFGTVFKITTWGESHGRAIGVVIDGCPAGLELSVEDIHREMRWRKPGQNAYVTPRGEQDEAEIFSGVFEGKTTGAPISIVIFNRDADSSKYTPIKDVLRPGHANFTYLSKYGIFDYRGGGRASARETACRVAAGAVAKKLLKHFHIKLIAYIQEIGGIAMSHSPMQGNGSLPDIDAVEKNVRASPLFCPEERAEKQMKEAIEQAKADGDSLGAVIELRSTFLPVGLGDPVYEKLEANLARAMLSIPATKGIEFGSGFSGARMKGSEHNDLFTTTSDGHVTTRTNHAGGTLGGISSGMPLIVRVAFKPTSSIMKSQETLNTQGEATSFALPEGSRHDPCVAIRAVPIVEAMAALVLADALLMNRCATL